jgi:HEAT repeats
MNSDELARLLYHAHGRDTEVASGYFADSRHLTIFEARKLAYDPSCQTAAQAEHLASCRRCPRLVSHLRDAIVHPGVRELAAWAENALDESRRRELTLHLETDGCHACQLRLRRSPRVAAYRALIAAGQAADVATRARRPISVFSPVTVGLRFSDQASTVQIYAMDRENGVSARLWQRENGTIEIVVRALDSAMANSCLRVELAGPEDSWEDEVVLTEHDKYGWMGRRVVGAVADILPRLLGDTGRGLVFTVSLPDGEPPAGQSFGKRDLGKLTPAEGGQILACLSDANTMVRYAAIRSISGKDATSAPVLLDPLIAILWDSWEDPAVRTAAAEALESFGLAAVTSVSVEALRHLLKDDDLQVREAAAAALQAMAG